MIEAKHSAELERVQREADRKLDEVNKKLEQLLNAKPAKQDGPSETALILQQMQKSQEAADKRFEALQKQMQDDKLNALLEEVKSIKNRPNPQNSSLLDQAEAMLKLKKLFGWGGDEEDDDEGEVDPNDDRPWWEKALDKLGGKLGDKLFEKFTNMEEKGEKVDREKFLAEMSQYADQAAAEAIAKRQRATLPAPPAAGLPLPAPPPPPPSTAQIPPAPATTLPPPPPPGVAPSAPESAPIPTAPIKLTLEQEIVIRVGGVLEMISREMELRPNEYHWTYEGCFNSLPESILEKVCAAPDPIAMIDAFAISGINPDGLAEMKAKLAANPKMVAWLKIGLDELKLWHVEKQKDPAFDPFADEDEEEEEGA